MRALTDLDIVFDTGYDISITRLYQPILDGILVVSEVLKARHKQLTILRWQPLEFQFRVWGFSVNEMNALWRDVSKALETVDKHWTVVYTENMVECSYDITKVI